MWIRTQMPEQEYPTLIETVGGHTITLTASLGKPLWAKVVFRPLANVAAEIDVFEGLKADAVAYIERLWSYLLQPGRYIA